MSGRGGRKKKNGGFGGGGGQKSNSFGNAGARPKKQEVTVLVKGFSKGTKLEKLDSFLKKKAKTPFHSNSKKMKGTNAVYTFNTQHDALGLLGIDGVYFSSRRLSITLAGDTATAPLLSDDKVAGAIALIRSKTSGLLLNLDGSLDGAFNDASMVATLFYAIATVCPNIESLAMGSNNISSLQLLSRLHLFTPNLKNLSLTNNKITSLVELDHLSGMAGSLQHLLLTGNPVQSSTDQIWYRGAIEAMFPGIKQIDSVPANGLADFGRGELFTLPSLAAPSYYSAPNLEAIATRFTAGFFNVWDTSRDDLIQVYADNCLFSLVFRSVAGPSDNAFPYSKVARNFLDVNRADHGKVISGKSRLLTTIKALPRTQHAPSTEFLVDCILLPSGMLHLSVHGKYQEEALTKQGSTFVVVRSFNRVFILASAQQSPLGVMILNDMLYLTKTESHKINVYSMPGAGAAGPAVDATVAGQLAAATGVTPDVASRYLAQFNNDGQAAYNAMMAKKNSGQAL